MLLVGSQVAQDRVVWRNPGWESLQRRKSSANGADGDWLRLVVGDVENSLGDLAVDDLDAKDLGLWEGGDDGDIEVWRDDLLVRDLIGWLKAVRCCFRSYDVAVQERVLMRLR